MSGESTETHVQSTGPASDPARCALVTGASRGIGAAIARRLAQQGWNVAVNYSNDEDGALAIAEEVRVLGTRGHAVRADVADPLAVGAMFEEVEARLGPVLALVNNAGIRHDRLLVGLGAAQWERVLAVNLSGAFHTTSRALGSMVRHRFGRIVNISTISASTPLPGQAAYAASKAGVEALTRTTAIEVARRGVTVNAIAPGLVQTGFVAEMTEGWARMVPARRTAQPEEIADIAGFLISGAAAYITGAVIRADGGLTAGIPIPARGTMQASASNANASDGPPNGSASLSSSATLSTAPPTE